MLLLQRVRCSLKKHGVIGLGKKTCLGAWRGVFGRKEILFTIDAVDIPEECGAVPEDIRIDRYHRREDVPHQVIEELSEHKGSRDLLESEVDKLFKVGGEGQTLWLLKRDGRIGCYHWTARAGYYGFYFVPMSDRDAVIFAAQTFPAFRRQGLYKILLRHTLQTLKQEGVTRCHAGVYTWNAGSIAAFTAAGFRPAGYLVNLEILGKTINIWSKKPEASAR